MSTQTPAVWTQSHLTLLIQSISAKNERRVATLLEILPSTLIDICDENGRTPLHLAVEVGNIHILDLILSKNIIDKEKRDNEDCTALHKAIENHSLDCVRALLAYGADANAPCQKFNDQTPICTSLMLKYDDIAGELLDYVTNFNEGAYGQTPLVLAMVKRSPLVPTIMEHRGNVPLQATELITALQYKDSSIFQESWRQHEYHPMLLKIISMLLTCCSFNNYEWMECMRMVLETCSTTGGFDVLDQLRTCYQCLIYRDNQMFRSLLQKFSRCFLPVQDRYELVYAFLSLGVPLSSLYTSHFTEDYTLADKSRMLHVLVEAGFDVDEYLFRIDSHSHPLTIKLFYRYTRLNLNFILQKLLMVRMPRPHMQLWLVKHLTRLCTPNSGNKRLHLMLQRQVNPECSLQVEGDVPPLLEMCRDVVRNIIQQKYKTSCFCCVLKDLNLPDELRQILKYRRKIRM